MVSWHLGTQNTGEPFRLDAVLFYMGNKVTTTKTHWLKGAGTMTWAAYTVLGPDKVHVTALIGASRYVDMDMNKFDARLSYKEFVAKGWTVGGTDHPSIRTLRSWIFD